MTIFSPEENARFWSGIDPDVRSILEDFEEREDWTYIISEHPELYNVISDIVEAATDSNVADLMEKDDTRTALLDKLIFTLSSISFSYCMLGLAFLDKKRLRGGSSLAESLVDRVAWSYYNATDTRYFAESRIVYERISLFVDSSLIVKLFTNLK